MNGFLTSNPVSYLLSGLVSGVVIGLIALSLVLIWRATHVLNFAQGAMATFGAYLGMQLLVYQVGPWHLIWWQFGPYHFNYWECMVAAIIAGLLVGGVTERVLVRPLYGKPEINPIVVMVGLLLALEAVMGAIWSSFPRSVPIPFSFIDWTVNGQPVALSPNDVFQIVAALVVALAIGALFRFTNLGLQLRASAAAPEVSRLLGVRVGRMLTLGWMLASAVGAVAAVILASNFATGLTPTMMEAPFAVAFVAAAVGGLESPSGALVAGVAFGVMEQFVTGYLSSDEVLPIALGILIVVLMIRPQGLFGKRVVRRV